MLIYADKPRARERLGAIRARDRALNHRGATRSGARTAGLVVGGLAWWSWWVPRGFIVAVGLLGLLGSSLSRTGRKVGSPEGGLHLPRAGGSRHRTTLRGVACARTRRSSRRYNPFLEIYRPSRRLSAVSLVVVCWCLPSFPARWRCLPSHQIFHLVCHQWMQRWRLLTKVHHPVLHRYLRLTEGQGRLCRL